MAGPVVELSGISKNYGALRPLRIERLSVAPGESVAIVGLDQTAAEMFVNLVTGATLPDSGDVLAFGRKTADIATSDEWLTVVDRFGIASHRAVLLDQLSVIQNIAMSFTLEIEPPPADVIERANALAEEVGLDVVVRGNPVGELTEADRARLRVARALALDAGLLVAEHLSAAVQPPTEVARLATTIRNVAERRGAATLTLTADSEFAAAVAARVLTLEPATGRLRPAGPLGWLRGRLR